jgi:UDP-glucose 4-epimerase
VRDFVYIDDIVEATLRMIQLPQDSATYNLGCGTGHSINQVKKMVEVACKGPLKTILRPTRSADVRSVVLDISRLTMRLDWEPKMDLVQGIARTLEWIQRPRTVVGSWAPND